MVKPTSDSQSYPEIIAPTVREAERIEAGGAIVPHEIAALPRHNADQVADHWNALKEEREYSAGLVTDCEEMCDRLSRLEHHLREGVLSDTLARLADYAGGVGHEDRDDPPRDPFPDNAKEQSNG